jgi:hypothetical protein
MQLPDDQMIVSLLPVFCDEWDKDLGDRGWEQARARLDLHALHQLGHTVAGSFTQFGFAFGAEAGKALMGAAKTGDWEAADRTVAALRALLDAIRAALAAQPAP